MNTSVYDVLDHLRNISSTNEKIQYLTEMKSTLLSEILIFAYSPIMYGISAHNIPAASIKIHMEDISFSFGLLKDLAERRVTGNAAKSACETMRSALDPEAEELFMMILNRDLKIGMNVKSINKAIPGLIFEASYMRMSLPAEAKPENWDYDAGVFGQEKKDGLFGNIVITEAGRSIFTRQGKELKLSLFPQSFIEEVNRLPLGIFHGEFNISFEGHLLPRKESNGIFNAVQKTLTPINPDYEVDYACWDYIVNEADNTRYKDRIFTVEQLLEQNLYVQAIPTVTLKSYQEVSDYAQAVVSSGKEGIIIKKRNGVWKNGTSRDCVKIKPVFHCELRVFGFKRGEPMSKYADTLGSLMCGTDDDDNGQLVVFVSGFTDAERDKIFNDIESYMYKVISVKFEAITKAKDGTYSLLSPVFDEFRFDKDETDSIERIIMMTGGVR